MQIAASKVKELRDMTGAGIMECKKALAEAAGEVEKAIEWMRKNGMAKADKKAGRTAADGVVYIKQADDGHSACLLEVNCETDFVARGDDFQKFVEQVAAVIMQHNPADVAALAELTIDQSGDSVETRRKALVAKIGENIQVRRFVRIESAGYIGVYAHGVRIGVLTNMTGGNAELAKDIAMHIAASRPVCVSEHDVPAEHIAKEKEILVAQAKQSGKPDDIIEKMVEGRLKKYLSDVTLLGQPFVKDPEQTVVKLLKSANAQVKAFYRFEVGEGIEKKVENFADEVMAQVRAS